jgi:ATP-dependent DNA helicase PIF1
MQNMRAQADTCFADYLLRIGNGTEEVFDGDYVQLPDDILIQNPSEDDSIDILIDRVFPNLVANCTSATYMRERAILFTRNEHVDAVNALMIDRFPGKHKIFYSFDSINDDSRNNYPLDFFQFDYS